MGRCVCVLHSTYCTVAPPEAVCFPQPTPAGSKYNIPHPAAGTKPNWEKSRPQGSRCPKVSRLVDFCRQTEKWLHLRSRARLPSFHDNRSSHRHLFKSIKLPFLCPSLVLVTSLSPQITSNLSAVHILRALAALPRGTAPPFAIAAATKLQRPHSFNPTCDCVAQSGTPLLKTPRHIKTTHYLEYLKSTFSRGIAASSRRRFASTAGGGEQEGATQGAIPALRASCLSYCIVSLSCRPHLGAVQDDQYADYLRPSAVPGSMTSHIPHDAPGSAFPG